MSHKKFGADWFSRLDGYWIQASRQAKFTYRSQLLTSEHGQRPGKIPVEMWNCHYQTYITNMGVIASKNNLFS